MSVRGETEPLQSLARAKRERKGAFCNSGAPRSDARERTYRFITEWQAEGRIGVSGRRIAMQNTLNGPRHAKLTFILCIRNAFEPSECQLSSDPFAMHAHAFKAKKDRLAAAGRKSFSERSISRRPPSRDRSFPREPSSRGFAD